MKRRITAVVLALCLVLPLLPMQARAAEIDSTGNCGANVTWTLDRDGVLTIRGTGPMGNLNEVNPSYTWYDKAKVLSVVIEPGVTSIGYMAFNGCSRLTSVTIPDSVTSIGIHAFTDCRSLTGVTIPSSAASIGSRAFDGCSSLTGLTVQSGVKSIGEEAFRECVNLTSVTIPGTLTNIEKQTFYGCTGLTDVTIKNGVRSIGEKAFWGCDSLTSVDIPDSLISIGEMAFLSCSSLANTAIPSGVTSIGSRAFEGCSSLASVTIPSGVDSIGSSAFSGCTGLASLTIQSGVKSIGEEAFFQCSSLTSVDIPDSVTSIGASAFHSCGGLTGVMIPDSVTSIGNAAFSDCTKLTSVDIPNSVTSIGTSVFNGCRSLTSAGIPSSVTNIGDYAFYRCTRLADVYYGGSEEQWGQITIGTYNDPLNKAAKHFQSQIPESFMVMFDSQGGSPVGSQIVLSGKYAAEPNPAPTRTGYTFQGWYQEESYTNIWRFFEDTVNENTTLYAKWTPTVCTVIFRPNGTGVTGNPSSISVKYGEKITAPDPAPQRTGYRFGGWYREADCANPWLFDQDAVTKSMSLYARWEPIPYFVTFDLNSTGAAGNFPQISAKYGETITAPIDEPHWTDHTFGGWYKEAACTTPWDFDTDTVTADITLYAKWTANTPAPKSHTVVFNSGGGGTVPSQTVLDGGKASRPDDPDPIDSHHTFGGWYREAGCTTPWNFDTDTVTADITLYAKWTPMRYTVRYGWNNDDGTYHAFVAQFVSYNQKTSAPDPAPQRAGYLFGGWYREPDCKTVWDFDKDTVTGDLSLYAKWTADTPGLQKHTVRFDAQGGSAVPSQTVVKGEKAVKPTSPTYSGHTFGGWYREAGCTTPWNFDTDTVTADITLYAKWTAVPKVYTITLDPNGGALPAGQSGTLTTGTDGRLPALPQAPVRDGYTFAGWYTAKSGGTAIGAGTVFTEDGTIYARWLQTSAEKEYYRIYTPGRTPGGTFSVSHTSAGEGTRITIEIDPKRDFVLDWVEVTNRDTGREVRLTRRYSGEYTFTMPDSDVELDLSFLDIYSGSQEAPAEQPQVQENPAQWYYQNGSICHVVTGLVPANTVLTRDMLVSLLYNLDPARSGEPAFWATSNHVIPDIYRSALYGVNKAVTREQTAMILFCYARYRGCSTYQRANLTGYADYLRVQDIARPALSWAKAAGVIAGTSASQLSPQGRLTCGQAATILSRLTSNVLWMR